VTRVAVALSCSVEQRTELMNLARSRTAEARLVERAKIILACLDGKRNDEVSHELGVRPNTVGLWRKRFAARGMAGLRDQPRRGKKPRYGAELRLRILRQLELPPPPGLAGWDGSTLAAALGVSDAAVWRVLRQEGIQLRRHRSWCVSTDPQFAAKAADIIGLYLNPPENALVLSVDEKPSIQALERATGYVQTSSGKIVQGLKSTYKRHGTVNLFAAPCSGPGAGSGSRHRGHPRQDHTDQKARRFPGLHVRDHRRPAVRPPNPRHPRQLLHP
jgi:transposase